VVTVDILTLTHRLFNQIFTKYSQYQVIYSVSGLQMQCHCSVFITVRL